MVVYFKGRIFEEPQSTMKTNSGSRFCRSYRRFLVVVIAIALFVVLLAPEALADGTNFNVLKNDTVYVIVQPTVSDQSVQCSSNSNSFSVGWSPNGTVLPFSVPELSPVAPNASTIFWFNPQSVGLYNLTIYFKADAPWNYTVGVVTFTPSFYSSASISSKATIENYYYGTPYGIPYYYGALFSVPTIGPPGSYTLTFDITAESPPSTANSFHFSLPSSAKLTLFAIVLTVLAYLNAFYDVSLYYRNKKEGISIRQWAFLIILVIASFIIMILILFI